jgi:hypothetical protein
MIAKETVRHAFFRQRIFFSPGYQFSRNRFGRLRFDMGRFYAFVEKKAPYDAFDRRRSPCSTTV